MASTLAVVSVLLAYTSLVVFAREVEFKSSQEHHGWGTAFDWVPMKKAWNMSRDEGKPMLVLFHKQYCAPCVELGLGEENDKKVTTTH